MNQNVNLLTKIQKGHNNLLGNVNVNMVNQANCSSNNLNNLKKEDLQEEYVDDFEKELKEAFDMFDEDGSKNISKEEFGNFMRKLGYRPTLVELQEMIDEVDKDKSGEIGFDEFKAIMTKTIRDEFTQNSSIEAFAVFDKSKSGKIKMEELKSILKNKGDQLMEDKEIDELLSYVPFDQDEQIDYKEFVKKTFELFK
jgi:calmodulin